MTKQIDEVDKLIGHLDTDLAEQIPCDGVPSDSGPLSCPVGEPAAYRTFVVCPRCKSYTATPLLYGEECIVKVRAFVRFVVRTRGLACTKCHSLVNESAFHVEPLP